MSFMFFMVDQIHESNSFTGIGPKCGLIFFSSVLETAQPNEGLEGKFIFLF